MLGIENVKKVVKFACDFTKQTAEALSDGWQWLNDTPKFFDEMLQMPGVVKAFPDFKKEIAELSAEERDELHQYVKIEFDIPNDQVESFIEDSLAFGFSAISLYEKFKTLKKVPPTV